jgi:hypothetical protein
MLRETPPDELITEFFQTFGLLGSMDSTLFTKKHIRLSDTEALLPLLEPYYPPAKAAIYIHPTLTPARAITIARHLLKAQAKRLEATEHSIAGVKSVYYKIICPLTSHPLSFD